jgi:enterochelin esterase-like enzyme
MKTFIVSILVFVSFMAFACKKADRTELPDPGPETDYVAFNSFAHFNQTLNALAALSDSVERTTRLNMLWDSLKENAQIPFVFTDSVAFLYKGSASEVAWAGDFNGWNPAANGFEGERIGQSTFFRMVQRFPANARLDYKLVVGFNWILDPANPHRQYSGFGPNSELRMPDWVFPQETVLGEGVFRGQFSGNQLINSLPDNLGYTVQYKVYTPYNYEDLHNLPVVYVTDGHEYADDRLGAMLIVLDNLIYSGAIEPVLAVFIDPRNPANLSENRRMDEYRANINYANFVADELVQHIDNTYKTDTSTTRRAILGTSLGGWNAAYFGMMRPDKFGLIAIHSPAFDAAIQQAYVSSEKLPLKFFMSTGLIFDTQNQAKQMRNTLEQKGYPLLYKEVNEGHSWGNWRALIDDPLKWFFGIDE